MQPKTHQADKARHQAAPLASQYGAIGPAAIAAALICKPKAKPQAQARPARETEAAES